MNRNNTILIISLIFLIGLCFGFIISSILVNWDKLNPNLMDFSIADVLDLFLTFIIGGVIVFLISDRINSSYKRKELLLEIITNFQESISDIYSIGLEYLKNPEVHKKSLLKKFKTASIFLNLICTQCDNHKIKIELTKVDFFEFKESLTDEAFDSPKKIDDKPIYEKYKILLTKIYSSKLNLYS